VENKKALRHILFTGRPGCGKSTLIERIVRRLETPKTGFFTREIREKGRRTGFSIDTLDGQKGVLAHRDIRGPYKVGAYGVDLEEFERIAVPSMKPQGKGTVVVVDEIGKMECFSSLFREALLEVLASENRLLGSIAARGSDFIRGIKNRKDVDLLRVTEKNRDALVDKVLGTFSQGHD
jgi:nucleoside-triphosphatase THEP1